MTEITVFTEYQDLKIFLEELFKQKMFKKIFYAIKVCIFKGTVYTFLNHSGASV